MSARAKQSITADPAAQELWRVAESGDLNDLTPVLACGVDVNARNEYGMTALMRAARQGHTRMVCALLKHGADPNLARNDQFTALALAAFFGHSETVRVLIEHGARTQVVTRFGTSPKMWAAARTFEEAARCFEKKVEKEAPAPIVVPAPAVSPPRAVAPAPAPLSAPVAAPSPVAAIPVVKTLKDPPEIWDLVHEVPREFNPGSAFVSRIMSMNKAFAAAALVGLVLLVVCGVWVLRNSQPENLTAEAPLPVQPAADVTVSAPAAATAEEIPDPGTPVEAVKKTPAPRRRPRPVLDNSVAVVEEQVTPAVVATPQFEKPKAPESSTKSTSTAPLSPQLITPAKSAPPKAKVIQWP